MPYPNPTLTPTQIAFYAQQAGFTGSGLQTITAIALAESGGSTNAVCNSCSGVSEYSVGLTQINTLAHPQYSNSQLTNPLYNMQAAYAVSNGGTNFTPWSTYTNGSFVNFLSQAQTAVNDISSYIASQSQVTAAYVGSNPTGSQGWLQGILNWSKTMAQGYVGETNAIGSSAKSTGNVLLGTPVVINDVGKILNFILTAKFTQWSQIVIGGVLILVGLVMFIPNITSFSTVQQISKVVS